MVSDIERVVSIIVNSVNKTRVREYKELTRVEIVREV
jgi:hypothetical protein